MGQPFHTGPLGSFSLHEKNKRSPINDLHSKKYRKIKRSGGGNVTLGFKTSGYIGHFWAYGKLIEPYLIEFVVTETKKKQNKC